MDLKKKHEDDKGCLIKERLKNQELQNQHDKMDKKMKKMIVELDKLSKVHTDYNRLMESFEKSEYIRNQQKNIIQNLNMEIDQLKKENELLAKSLNVAFTDEATKKKKKSNTGVTKSAKASKKKLMM